MRLASTFLLISFLLVLVSCREKTLFTEIPVSNSGIDFNNKIVEDDVLNPLKEVNIYNGGGVGAGDFNNDGLIDLYFTGNMVPNRLYLNKGDLKFEDVTATSKADGEGRWSRGVSVVDINSDGLDDLYIAAAITKEGEKRKNLLYINQGVQTDGVPVFREMAAEYGLADSSHSVMGYFFDADNDGDLDMYLVVNHHLTMENQNKFRPIRADGSHPSTGRLYRNDWNNELNHPYFTNISIEAGIKTEGYGHAAIITDINHDGWKDIYVTNDFISNNILYINKRDGTFIDSTQQYFKQTSTFSMGADMQDINNDGLPDLVELDMNPEDNYRDKMIMDGNSYQYLDNFKRYGYQIQYMRNTLQVNQGRTINENDSLGHYTFSQTGFLSGIAETDWSWGPILTDFDHDGFRDIIVTNGYPKDVTNHDFMVYRSEAALVAPPSHLLRQVPEVKIRNYAYRNAGDMRFENKTKEWGFHTKTFSNGGIYADLDNDGDMDVVVNNINGEALLYRNNVSDKENGNNYLNITLEGNKQNPHGFGAWVYVYSNERQQVYEHSPYRGYVSTHQNIAHFGLADAAKADSVVVIWPDAKKQVIASVDANQKLTVHYRNANARHDFTGPSVATNNLFTDVTRSAGIGYEHKEKDFPDFVIQKLLPHKFSEYSPALAVGDIDGNGLDDIVCGGNSANPAKLFFQQGDGTFSSKELYPGRQPDSYEIYNGISANLIGSNFKDAGILLFDADNDNDLDIYVAAGGYAYKPGTSSYDDRLYINDGKGNYTSDTSSLPQYRVSKSCVRAEDFDKDGDLDLFVAGRVEPHAYPRPVSSKLFRNDSKNGKVIFTDVTAQIADGLSNIGLVADAVFTDFDSDGWPDLVLAGEWMPLTFFKNTNGRFANITAQTGLSETAGWWNSIAPGDFDNDGDIDYIVGNLGLNAFYRASENYPVCVTADDFDSNGSYDAFVSLHLPATHDNEKLVEFPANTRDEVFKQMISLKKRFTNYHSFATASIDQIFTEEERKKALRLMAKTMAHVYCKNEGNGRFTLTNLPNETQVSVLNGFVVEDFDGDGNLDIIMNGNDYGTEVSAGRYDALNGLVMKGDGTGKFKPLSISESGIYIPGNGKALVQLKRANGNYMVAASENNGPLRLFSFKKQMRYLPLSAGDKAMTIRYKDGRTQRRELYSGYSFLSQSSKGVLVNESMSSVEVTDNLGRKRNILN